MKGFESRPWPLWLMSTLVGAVMVILVAACAALRPTPAPPPAIVVSGCRVPAPGMRRVGFEFEFDVAEANFSLRTATNDMPPQVFYSISLKNRTDSAMEISGGPLGFEVEWESAFAIFSEHVDPAQLSSPLASPAGYQERDVRDTYGQVVGKDCWGHFKNGERWRLVRFSRGGRVGYPPTPAGVAQLYDQIISSACFPPAPGR